MALGLIVACVGSIPAPNARAAQIDIAGPSGSVAFGASVVVLPNGNLVVVDYEASVNARNAGAVHLYSATGVLISTLRGDKPDDYVGGGGVVVLRNGNFVVLSPSWSSVASSNVGAVTWIDGIHGLSGTVSPDNSLVGTQNGDFVGSDGVTPLANGNYVVVSSQWRNGVVEYAGAVTWGDGRTGISGVVSKGNSLVGTTANDSIGSGDRPPAGQVFALPNGNYVVVSSHWNNGAAPSAGAVTWANGSSGLRGEVSMTNSLVGTTINDKVGAGGVTILDNGNYVVTSSSWDNGNVVDAGAVTWVDGGKGLSGAVSPHNSLVGTTGGDTIGYAQYARTTALGNGNYVVPSSSWSNGAIPYVGALTWGDGTRGATGPVSAQNSLVGTTSHDAVGERVIALANGNYVTSSSYWTNGDAQLAGAVTWADGRTGRTGAVSAENSLVGSTTADFIGTEIVALSNGDYVVSSPNWGDDDASARGAVTWGDGKAGTTGMISPRNSLVKTAQTDVGGIVALTNGNYVVVSPRWPNDDHVGPTVGAVAWIDGNAPTSGELTADRALVGLHSEERFGEGPVVALNNGNYVISTPLWGAPSPVGAVTWADGNHGLSGVISSTNSMIGPVRDGLLGNHGIAPLDDGNYLALSAPFLDGTTTVTTVTLIDGSQSVTGQAPDETSIRGIIPFRQAKPTYAYDASRHALWVGRPSENIVSKVSLKSSPHSRPHRRPIPSILLHVRPH
jgi:hypothetical protein